MRIPESVNIIATRLAKAQLNETEDSVRKAILRAFVRSVTICSHHTREGSWRNR